TGVDYSIFMQLALRRYHGDTQMAYRSVGRALLLCGGAGLSCFWLLAFFPPAGLGSLGAGGAGGIASSINLSIFFPPTFLTFVQRRRRQDSQHSTAREATAPHEPCAKGGLLAPTLSSRGGEGEDLSSAVHGFTEPGHGASPSPPLEDRAWERRPSYSRTAPQ